MTRTNAHARRTLYLGRRSIRATTNPIRAPARRARARSRRRLRLRRRGQRVVRRSPHVRARPRVRRPDRSTDAFKRRRQRVVHDGFARDEKRREKPVVDVERALPPRVPQVDGKHQLRARRRERGRSASRRERRAIAPCVPCTRDRAPRARRRRNRTREASPTTRSPPPSRCTIRVGRRVFYDRVRAS